MHLVVVDPCHTEALPLQVMGHPSHVAADVAAVESFAQWAEQPANSIKPHSISAYSCPPELLMVNRAVESMSVDIRNTDKFGDRATVPL
jgi:hypothetical protein